MPVRGLGSGGAKASLPEREGQCCWPAQGLACFGLCHALNGALDGVCWYVFEVCDVMSGQGLMSARLVSGLSLWEAVGPTAYWRREWCSPKKQRQTDKQTDMATMLRYHFRAEEKSQGPLCCAAELKRAGELCWPPGPPVQRAPMVGCLTVASGMAVQWRAYQSVDASAAGQP